MTATAISIIERAGRPLALSRELARGGEGAIVAVEGRPAVVAKLYHTPPDARKVAKLQAMVAGQTDRLLALAAWPLETLHAGPGGPVVGVLLPYVADHKDIHLLYGPKSRKVEFPEARWAFLVHAAANAARAVRVVHEHGHVIGDINQGSICVSDQATVKLLDCDSFQIAASSQVFRCLVGVPTHTPPELQRTSLGAVTRTPNHDAFGLAVVVFQLLFMGRHPFAGAFQGVGEMPLERAIAEYRFAYGRWAAARQMAPPPGSLPLRAVSPPVVDLFRRAFLPDGAKAGGRPAPEEWIAALEALAGSLRRCAKQPAHEFWDGLASCPWCELEAQAGVAFFNPVAPASRPARRGFDIEVVWRQITATRSPGPLPELAAAPATPPAEAAVRLGRRRRGLRNTGLALLLIVVALFQLIGALVPPAYASLAALGLLLAGGGAVALVGANLVPRSAKARVARQRRALEALVAQWVREAGPEAFAARLAELEQAHAAYLDLPAERARRLAVLEGTRRERQLARFLEQQRIDRALIPGVGPARRATLQSHGIETAADVTAAALARVSGIGPVLTGALLVWRTAVEARFRFDPNQAIDAADIAALDRELDERRQELERQLAQGAALLRQTRQQTFLRRETLRPAIAAAARELAQAAADLRAS